MFSRPTGITVAGAVLQAALLISKKLSDLRPASLKHYQDTV